MKSEDFIKNESDFVVTETLLKVNVPAEQILDSLREKRATGQLTFYFIDGGVRSVMLVEKTKSQESGRGKSRNNRCNQ